MLAAGSPASAEIPGPPLEAAEATPGAFCPPRGGAGSGSEGLGGAGFAGAVVAIALIARRRREPA